MSTPTPPLEDWPAAKSGHPLLDSPFAGLALMLLAMALIPTMDAFAKLLSDRYHLIQIVWARYFFHLVLFLPFVIWRFGFSSLRPQRLGLQLLRGTFLLVSTGLFFAAIARIPLADALATVFIYPFIITACAPLLLGEKVGIRRWTAVAVGFLGACVIIRPGFGVMDIGTLLAMAAGSAYAFYVLTTRKLARSAPATVMLAFTGLVGALASSAAVPFVWIWPGPTDWLIMISIGLIAATGHLLIILAYERAEASQLSPLGYSEIVSATLLGFFIFGDLPDTLTWLGIAIVVASGVYISLREGRARRA